MSPFILGIVASSVPTLLPAYELISTIYGDGSASSITFSSIPNTYKDLQLRFVVKSTQSGVSSYIGVTLNGDIAATYSSHSIAGNGNSVINEASTTSFGLDILTDTTYTDYVGSAIIDFAEYANTSKYKTAKGIGVRDNSVIYVKGGSWRSTAAISSITLYVSGQQFQSISRFSLYGIKG